RGARARGRAVRLRGCDCRCSHGSAQPDDLRRLPRSGRPLRPPALDRRDRARGREPDLARQRPPDAEAPLARACPDPALRRPRQRGLPAAGHALARRGLLAPGARRRLGNDGAQGPRLSGSLTPMPPHADVSLDDARILLAEDSRFQATVTCRALEGAGCSVRVEHDGRAALAALDEAEFDLLVTDWMMPGCDGL